MLFSLLMGANPLLRFELVSTLANLLDTHFHPLLYTPPPPSTHIHTDPHPAYKIDMT